MKSTLLLFSILATLHLSAQNYGNIWHFGDNLGLDFTDCEPTVISGSNNGFEGCASISDEYGQLLFYTNSITIWNANHEVMYGSTNPFIVSTTSQVIIIPRPSFENRYYVITTPIQALSYYSLQYFEIDMSLNGGLGDVISAENEMTELIVTEQIAATYHSNGTDIWLMSHEYGTDAFLAYLVNSDGINLTPVVSNVGPSHLALDLVTVDARGEIKFSPDGTKIAFNANGVGEYDSSNILCLLDFDNSAGIVSNPINLPYSRGEFGLSFSPDNSKLYGATWKALGFNALDYNYLYQFDITSNDSSTIASSKYIVDSVSTGISYGYGSLKIGPNGKIYVRTSGTDSLGVINAPDLEGVLCNYDPNAIFLGWYPGQYGLNNYIEYQTYCSTLSTDDINAAKEKKLVRIIDLMGRESKDVPNKVLIHIYDDHTRKKVFRMEL